MLLLEHERNFIIVEKNFTIRWVFADMDEVFYVFRILFINGLIFLFVCSFCLLILKGQSENPEMRKNKGAAKAGRISFFFNRQTHVL